jgi:hypothetical protein
VLVLRDFGALGCLERLSKLIDSTSVKAWMIEKQELEKSTYTSKIPKETCPRRENTRERHDKGRTVDATSKETMPCTLQHENQSKGKRRTTPFYAVPFGVYLT